MRVGETIYGRRRWLGAGALWSGTNKNRDVSTGSLARPFTRSLAPLTRLLAPEKKKVTSRDDSFSFSLFFIKDSAKYNFFVQFQSASNAISEWKVDLAKK